MQLSDFNYDLPDEFIARYPLAERSASRLLCLNKQTGEVTHRYFRDLIDMITPNDLVVCNNSQVISARMFGNKASGGKIEVLADRVLDEHRILAHVRASKPPKPQSILEFVDGVTFTVIQRHDDLYELHCNDPQPVMEVIEAIGEVPLPVYFRRAPEESDKLRYQTIYAEHKGSVAAPTAGLHFDHEMFAALKAKGISIAYVTLHVGAGTFAPVRVDDVTKHIMHAEGIRVTEDVCEQVRQTKARGGRVIAVGTTAARCLETATLSGQIKPYDGDTNIFIYPGIPFRCVDALITNFHAPKSSLLMLVSAMAGYDNIMRAYQIALHEQYRFLSYGDAMFIN